MKKLVYLTVLGLQLLFINCFSQNLVKNPDFEAYGNPPYDLDEITRALNWDPGNNDPVYHFPEYFNRNGAYPAGIPLSIHGYRESDSTIYHWSRFNPYDGHAGIVTFGTKGQNNRTHLSGDFLNLPGPQIKRGKTYYFSVRVALDDTSRWATGLQLYLSVNDIDMNVNPAPTNNVYHASYNKPILDTEWVTWAGSFIANADYDGFAIGNFIRDDLSKLHYRDQCTDSIPDGAGDTIVIPPCSAPYAYYRIDNVCISLSSNDCERVTTITQSLPMGRGNVTDNRVRIYPNPATDFIKWDHSMNAELINQQSKLVASCNKCTLLDVSLLPRGLYYLRLDTDYSRLVLLN